MKDQRELLWAASRLLSYPSSELGERLLEIERSARELPPGPRVRFGRFISHARSTELIELQQEYVRTFDLSDRTPLHLTYSQLGDGRDRGATLAALKGRYRAAGLDPQGSELPDFLPMVLEFVAIAPDAAAREVAGEFAPTVAKLAAGLEAARSPYADIVAPVADVLRALAPGPTMRWWGR